VVLLSPSFSRKDESIFPRALDRLSRVFGHLPYTLVLKMIGPAFGSSLPSARRDLLVNELKNNNPRFVRSQTRSYLAYLDRHGSLAKRFCETGVRAWIVFGEKDDIGLAPAERELLTAASNVTLVEIADTGHFALNNKPDQIAAIVLQAVKNARSERS
jgi:pimeloyl-ACP methyl ester carboxylesterase